MADEKFSLSALATLEEFCPLVGMLHIFSEEWRGLDATVLID
jgi:hypothetical protein